MFTASTRRIASVCSSSCILCAACTGTLHPDSCPADSCSGLADLMISSRKLDTITFPALLPSTFPAPIGRNPGFLSSGIRRQDRKVSMAFASFQCIVSLSCLSCLSCQQWLCINQYNFQQFVYMLDSFSNHLHPPPKVQNHLWFLGWLCELHLQ